jgi:hypothetical protein
MKSHDFHVAADYLEEGSFPEEIVTVVRALGNRNSVRLRQNEDGTLRMVAPDEGWQERAIAAAVRENREHPREVAIDFRHVDVRRRGGRSDTQIVLELAIRLGMRDHERQDAYSILYDEGNRRFVVTDLTMPEPTPSAPA